MDDLLDEDLNLGLELFVSRVVDDLPVDVVWVKDGVHPEDWNELLPLPVTNDLPAQITQSILDRLLEGRFKLTIEAMNKLEPLALNFRGSVDEEIVSLHDLSRNLLEGVDEILFSDFKRIFLLSDELRQKVELLLDVCQNRS